MVHIVDKINIEEIEDNTKLMKWFENKFFRKVCANISSVKALK